MVDMYVAPALEQRSTGVKINKMKNVQDVRKLWRICQTFMRLFFSPSCLDFRSLGV